MSNRTALVTGITGQDGSYLAEFLLRNGYTLHGLIRKASTLNTQRSDHIYVDPHEPETRLKLHYGDISDAGQLTNLIYDIRPDELYHLAAQSHVRVSFDMPENTANVTGLGTTRIIEAIRKGGIKTKYYQASSSEMFGAAAPPQNERTPFYPRSPYAAAKVNRKPYVEVWGTGAPRREFLYVDDLADALIFLMDRYNEAMPINIGVGEDI